MRNPRKLKIRTLPKGRRKWRDNDNVMLHACFALLADFVENERPFDGMIDWSANEEARAVKAEIETLYKWWKNYEDDSMRCTDMERVSPPDASTEDFKMSRWVTVDDNFEEEDKMLHRLINIRRYLWT